jgi:hypothetical protein
VDDILDLEIERAVAGGHMLARHDGRVVFVSGTIPGERVRARVTRSTAGPAGRPDRADDGPRDGAADEAAALPGLGPSRRALRVRVGAEAFVLAAAAAVSGVLVQADPGVGAREYLRVVRMGTRVAAVVSDDLTAGRPLVKVSIRKYSGTPDVGVEELSIRVSAPDGTIGRRYDLVRQPQRDTFDARLDLPAAGRWTMQLSYRVSDVDRGDATIVLPVG